MKPRHKRFMFILVGIAILSSAVGLVLYALQKQETIFLPN